MIRFFTLVMMFFLITHGFCQVSGTDSLFEDGKNRFQPKKFNYSVTLGSQFTAVSGFGSGLSTFVTPRFSYNLSNRFRIGGGISLIQTNYFQARSYWQNEQASGSNGNFMSGMIFVDGQYIVNKRLSIYGSAYKQIPISQDPLPYNPFNPVSAQGAQGINFNVGYKIGEHVLIEAGFRYSEGVNPYHADPFYRNSSVYDPFGMPQSFGSPRW